MPGFLCQIPEQILALLMEISNLYFFLPYYRFVCFDEAGKLLFTKVPGVVYVAIGMVLLWQ